MSLRASRLGGVPPRDADGLRSYFGRHLSAERGTGVLGRSSVRRPVSHGGALGGVVDLREVQFSELSGDR